MPLRIIHVLRNPFDIIATAISKRTFKKDYGQAKQDFNSSNAGKFNPISLEKEEKRIFEQFNAVADMIEHVFGEENVLELHNCELIADPRGTISKIFDFLEVPVTNQFLDTTSKKVFKTVSRTRDLIEWSPEQVKEIEARIKKLKMLSRYNFTSD